MNFLKHIFFILVLMASPVWAASLESAAPNTAAPSFLSAVQDVPLSPGMVELTGQTTVFDKAEGRFVESVAEMQSMSPEDTRRFYDDTLPQLGWKRSGEGQFRRESELLHISFETLEGRNYARFTLSPAK